MSKVWLVKGMKLLRKSLELEPCELNELDWKEDVSTKSSRLSQHFCAFANLPGGGYLVFGINDRTGAVLGIKKDKIDKILGTLSNISRNNIEPSQQIDHSVEEYRGKSVLICHIKESALKPVHLRGHTVEDTFIRSGGTTRSAVRHEVGELFLNSKPFRFEEVNVSKLLGFRDVIQLLDYQKYAQLLDRPVPKQDDELVEWLESEKLVTQYSENEFYITNLGALAVARKLKEFDSLYRKTMRIIKYDGLNKKDTVQEIEIEAGYALAFDEIMKYIKLLVPTSEVIKDAFRTETSIYPDIAIRELVANALIHQDFGVRGKGPTVEIYDNRIEITNPGSLLPNKKIDRLIGTSPESRNEILASTFRRLGICEERGTGLQKTLMHVELFGLPPIHFEQGENYFKVTLFSPKKYGEMSSKEKIEACYQHSIIKYLSSLALTNKSLRERFKVSEKQRAVVSRIIKSALDKGLIKSKDPERTSTKFTEYIPYWA